MASSITQLLLDELKVPYTRSFLDETEQSLPFGNSLWTVTHILDLYRVGNSSIRVSDKARLGEVPVPFVAQVGRECVVVTGVDRDNVTFRTLRGRGVARREEFVSEWSGVAVVCSPDASSGEPGLREHRRRYAFDIVRRVAVIAAVSIFIVLPLAAYRAAWGVVVMTALGIAGLWLSWLLLRTSVHNESRAAHRLCSIFSGGPGGCRHTEVRLAARYDLSEAGMAFFAANVAMCAIAPAHALGAVAAVTALALPFTLWSIVYQGFKARKWCVLCILVDIVVWTLFAVSLTAGAYSLLSFSPSTYCVPVIMLGLAFLIALEAVHAAVRGYSRLRTLRRDLNRLRSLKYDSRVWDILHSSAPERKADGCTSSLVFGGDDPSKPEVTILGNPLCDPCARMHGRLQPLIDAGFAIRYVFSYFSKTLDVINRRIAESYFTDGADATWQRLGRWYASGPAPDATFAPEMHGFQEIGDEVDAELAAHEQWVEKTGITATPYVLVDGRELPPRYEVEDLLYLY